MGLPFQSQPSLTVGFGKEDGGRHLISRNVYFGFRCSDLYTVLDVIMSLGATLFWSLNGDV
jgi:hypothetical protein